MYLCTHIGYIGYKYVGGAFIFFVGLCIYICIHVWEWILLELLKERFNIHININK